MQSYTSMMLACLPLALVVGQFSQLVQDPVRTMTLHWIIFFVFSILSRPRFLLDSLMRWLYVLTVFSPCIYALVVLMGAPFTSHLRETTTFSVSLSILCFSLRHHDPDHGLTLSQVFATNIDGTDNSAPRQHAHRLQMLATMAGAYLGAIPIPLDWDRDWQRWPVTVYAGAAVGHLAGVLLGGITAQSF
jgi:phosphatidylinositol glycan class F